MPGIALVFVAVLLQALSNGLLSENLGGRESLLFSFLSFGVATVIFLVVSRVRSRRNGGVADSIRPAVGPLAWLNLATAVTFLGFYWSLSLIPAPLAVAVEAGVGPLVLICLRYRSLGFAQRRGQTMIGVLALVLAVSAAARVVSGGEFGSVHVALLGFAIAALAGISAATVPLLSVRLAGLNASPARVTAHRFHLTYTLAFAILLIGGFPADTVHNASRMVFLVVVAAFGTALPLFILQVGMQQTAPLMVALAVSSLPSLTYLSASVLGRQSFDRLTFVLVSGSLVLAFIGPFLIRALDQRRSVAVAPSP
ncbi:MAG: hypothetical protein ACRDQ5_14405 [Sciscionella sp.]